MRKNLAKQLHVSDTRFVHQFWSKYCLQKLLRFCFHVCRCGAHSVRDLNQTHSCNCLKIPQWLAKCGLHFFVWCLCASFAIFIIVKQWKQHDIYVKCSNFMTCVHVSHDHNTVYGFVPLLMVVAYCIASNLCVAFDAHHERMVQRHPEGEYHSDVRRCCRCLQTMEHLQQGLCSCCRGKMCVRAMRWFTIASNDFNVFLVCILHSQQSVFSIQPRSQHVWCPYWVSCSDCSRGVHIEGKVA